MSDETRERIRKREAIGKTHNRLLYVFIFVMLFGYMLFFTSSLWLPKPYQGVEVVPIGSEVVFGDRTITIDSCRYSSKQRIMEIICHVDNTSLDGIDTYTWQVSAPGKLLDTEVVVDTKEIVVLHVNKVPRRWTELSITASLKDKDRKKDTTFEPIKVYINDKSAEAVSSIKKHTTKEYLEISANSKIESYEKEIRKIEKNEQELKDKIHTAEQQIADLTDAMQYQTEEEQMRTGEEIAGIQSEKDNITSELLEKQKAADEYHEKIKLLKEYIEKL